MTTRRTIAERLALCFIPEPNSGCWLWVLRVDREGYGRFKSEGQSALAHRESWRAFKGEIPAGLFVCHKCDVRSCINPGHLFLGTQADNLRDMREKGRENISPAFRESSTSFVRGQCAGEANPGHKLVEEDVISIRADSRSDQILAAQYGVRKVTITNARTGVTWKHLPLTKRHNL